MEPHQPAIDPAEVECEARDIAVAQGRSPAQITPEDREQARANLTGAATPERPDGQPREPEEGTQRQTPVLRPEDENQLDAEMALRGVEDAETQQQDAAEEEATGHPGASDL